jgi:HK97 family phage portal protein
VAIPLLSPFVGFVRLTYRTVKGGLRAMSGGSMWDRGGPLWSTTTAGQSRKTKSGERVDHTQAMTLPTYWSCLTGIAADIAKVPVSAVRRMLPRGRETLYDHPATRLLDEDANPNCAAFTFRETLTGWALGWGNGYAEVQRDGRGNPVALWPVHPSRVVVKVSPDDVVTYYVRVDDVVASVKWAEVPAGNMFHLRGYGDGIEGQSVLANASESIGLALAGQSFAASFFGNDLSISTLVSLKVPLADDKFQQYKKDLVKTYAGAANAYGVMVSNGDADLRRMSINPDEAQVLESRTFSVPEVCRWFHRSPQKVGHSDKAQGWGTLDALQVADTTDCLMPWWIRWEQEARRKLLDPADRTVRVKHWIQALMRGEPKTRSEVIKNRVLSGTLTPNEAREFEDEEPSKDLGADMLWMQGANQPISVLVKGPAPTPPPPSAPPEGDGPDPEDPVEDAPEGPDDVPPADAKDPAPEAVAAPDPVAAAPVDDGPWLRPLFDVAAARIVSKECLSVGKRVEKSAPMDPWASEFYAKQRGFVAAEFLPVVTALARAESGPAHDALAALAAGLWKDPRVRTAEAFRVPERDLAAALATLVFDTCCAALSRKEAA